jgi:hypothetical protein
VSGWGVVAAGYLVAGLVWIGLVLWATRAGRSRP